MTDTPPTDDEREGLARAIKPTMNKRPLIDASQSRINDIVAGWIAEVTLAYLAPIRAREIAAAEARERARVVHHARKLAQLNHRWATENKELQREHIALSSAYSTIADTFERGEHDTGKEG